MLPKISNALAPINATLALDVYADPYTFADTYPVGTPERDAVIHAYQAVQKLLTITGLCLVGLYRCSFHLEVGTNAALTVFDSHCCVPLPTGLLPAR